MLAVEWPADSVQRAEPARPDARAAKKKLLSTGCKLGKVTKPKKSGKKKLIVADTSPPARVRGLAYGTKINLTMKVKKKKK